VVPRYLILSTSAMSQCHLQQCCTCLVHNINTLHLGQADTSLTLEV
jgi:hypothetical protein